MALGAAPQDMLRLFILNGLKMSSVGVSLGFLILFGLAWIAPTGDVQNLSYLSPFLVSLLLMIGLAVAASWLPARRAIAVSPMVAIRNDIHPSWMTLKTTLHELTGRVSHLVAMPLQRNSQAPDITAAIVDASRQAESFDEALMAALRSLRTCIEATSVFLLQRSADGSFVLNFADPDGRPRKSANYQKIRYFLIESFTFPRRCP